jgi:translation initiation factor 2 beta subunit (eIF-2beta)/eIF-5
MSTTSPRDGATGRYVRRFPTCDSCDSVLAENLLGQLRCLFRRCDRYGDVAGTVPGVDVGSLDADSITRAITKELALQGPA